MSFYIKQVAATGEGKILSSIDFNNGLNIIYGPSNTGKSFVIEVIDFVLGRKKPSFDTLTGYDTFSVTLETDDGFDVKIVRKIGENKVKLESKAPDINSGAYRISKRELSGVLLKLLGIKDEHSIISNMNKETKFLSFRTFIHTLLIDEESIISKESIICRDKYTTTSTLSALVFLIYGIDANDVDKNEEPAIKEAKKIAVAAYIKKQIKAFSEQKKEINDTLALMGDNDLNVQIQNIVHELEETELKITNAAGKSRKLLKNIYELTAQLEEAEFLKDRYDALESQYLSDIKRLEFIIDGETTMAERTNIVKCPFCNSDIENHNISTYTSASKTELNLVKLQISDLRKAEADIDEEISMLKTRLETAKIENNEITGIIETELKPHITELTALLNNYKHVQKLRDKEEFIKELSQKMSADVFEVENEEFNDTKYNVKDNFDREFIEVFNKYLDEALSECSYKDYLTSRLDMSNFDIVVNAEKKESEGKGYRGFLNSVFALVMMKYLSLHAMYKPKLLMIYSTLTNLTEARGDEEKKNNMKKSLFEYFVKCSDLGQIIIIENKIPDIDYKDTNIIEFTKDKENGRYGFLINLYGNEE